MKVSKRKGKHSSQRERKERPTFVSACFVRGYSLVGLLVDVSGVDSGTTVSGCIDVLVGEVPAVEVAGASTQVCSEPQPAQIRGQAPRSDWVNLGPDIGQVPGNTRQGDNVGCSFDRTLETEEEGHPDEVEAQLDREERCSLL